ncbi:hypothetical protein [Methanococcoides methylutens]|uniref:CAAX amino terminal protease family protein n=1 Tax=Methanococcoides methylutens MM1 TaxID=1434104 RepID=A0A0E3SPK8_METMT|nr:hypothetical protein [Methanococcoides methylutens]AKB84521.1 hypothetical protein MCMEM_0468 [Methanococcoides methylutens MM1]
MDKLTSSDRTFIGLIVVMVLGKATWEYFDVNHPIVQQWTATWSAIIVVALLGAVCIKLAPKAGFPEIWDQKIPNKQRIVIPILLGIGFSIIEILVGLALQLPNIHVKFPLSIPVYVSGGIFLEILYHLIPVVALTWLISTILLKGERQNQAFIAVAILASLWEPVMQITGMQQMGMLTSAFFAVGLFIFIFAGNLIPITLFRKYGFLAPVIWRLADYSIWHVIWPILYY